MSLKNIVLWFLVGCVIGSAVFGQDVRRYVVNVDQVRLMGKWPIEVTSPRTCPGGPYQEVEFQKGDYTLWPFTPKEGAKFIGNGSTVPSYGNWMALQNASFCDFNFVGSIVLRPHWNPMPDPSTRDIVFSRCVFRYQVRCRFGAYNITFENCDWHRRGVIGASDYVGLYFSEYTAERPPNAVVRKCTFAGFTDGIQFDNSAVGAFAGCLVEDCDFWVWPEHYKDEGRQCVPGIENAIDIKSGGTEANPLKIIRCKWRGFRPVITTSGGGIGYGLTMHSNASWVTVEDCEASDSEVALQQNSYGLGIVFRRLKVYGIHFHGAAVPSNWLDRVGCVWTGVGPWTAIACEAYDYDKLKQYDNRAGQVFLESE